MNETRIKIYTCQKMTGRMQDEMRVEAEMLVRVLDNYGFIALNPVIEEDIPHIHEILPVGDSETLERYWKRDKEMIREADIIMDYDTQNKSDGTINEVGYSRWCLWKPTVRVWAGNGGIISRMENDLTVPDLLTALDEIQERWGNYDKLHWWRKGLWERGFGPWMEYQMDMNQRYGVKHMSLIKVV